MKTEAICINLTLANIRLTVITLMIAILISWNTPVFLTCFKTILSITSLTMQRALKPDWIPTVEKIVVDI